MIGRNRVVITGLGVLAANGIGKDAFWNSLLAGESGIGPITLFDASELPFSIAGEVSDFSPYDYIDKSFKPKRMARRGVGLASQASNAHIVQGTQTMASMAIILVFVWIARLENPAASAANSAPAGLMARLRPRP